MAWKKGESGNPSGRPRGIPSPSTRLRQAIAADLPDILSTLVAQALAGDVSAAKLLLDRVVPPLRAERVPWPVPAALEGQQGILGALAHGELSVDDACRLLNALRQEPPAAEVVVRWEGNE